MSIDDTDRTTKTASARGIIWWRADAVEGCAYCGSPECTSYEHALWARGNESTWLRAVAA